MVENKHDDFACPGPSAERIARLTTDAGSAGGDHGERNERQSGSGLPRLAQPWEVREACGMKKLFQFVAFVHVVASLGLASCGGLATSGNGGSSGEGGSSGSGGSSGAGGAVGSGGTSGAGGSVGAAGTAGSNGGGSGGGGSSGAQHDAGSPQSESGCGMPTTWTFCDGKWHSGSEALLPCSSEETLGNSCKPAPDQMCFVCMSDGTGHELICVGPRYRWTSVGLAVCQP
jgi:hypothetical protein